MAAEPLFVDSGGFYALVSPESERHELAVEPPVKGSPVSVSVQEWEPGPSAAIAPPASYT
jgi:hypothetical protein